MSERLRNTPEVVTPNMNPVDEEMHALLNQYLPKRKPLDLEKYNWDAIQPDLVDPDLLKCLRFVAEVESNPEAPAEIALKAADNAGATWQRSFTEKAWLPEETMHGVLLREAAIRYGAASEAVIDKEIEEVRQRGFPIADNYSHLKAITYSWIQEIITRRFYEAMQSGTKDPILKSILVDTAKQENFHGYVYLQGAKATLKSNPNNAKEVVETVSEFIMPGHHMVPELQRDAPKWAKQFNFPLHLLLRDISDGLVELVGHEGLGEIILCYGAKNLPWYLKAPLTPLRIVAKSPIPPTNRIVGKLADMATRQKK